MNEHIHTYMQNIHTQVDTYKQKHDHAFTHIYIRTCKYIYAHTDIYTTQRHKYTYTSTHIYTQIPPHSLHTHAFHVFEKVLLPFFQKIDTEQLSED